MSIDKNVEWSSVKSDDHVELRGAFGSKSYVINKVAVAFWDGKDSEKAQAFLNRCVNETNKRNKK